MTTVYILASPLLRVWSLAGNTRHDASPYCLSIPSCVVPWQRVGIVARVWLFLKDLYLQSEQTFPGCFNGNIVSLSTVAGAERTTPLLHRLSAERRPRR